MRSALPALRLGAAAALLAGLALALPSAAAEPYTDDTGVLTVPAVGVSASDFAFAFATCPTPPPTQGADVWVYELPEDVAVAGTQVTVTGDDGGSPLDLTGFLYADDCSYTRDVSGSPLAFALEGDERYLAVVTSTAPLFDARLALTAVPGGGSVPTPAPTAGPTTPPAPPATGGTVRRSYAGGVDDPLYPEDSTAVASLEFAGQWGMRVIRAEQAWQEQRATGAGITVAVLDSGLDVGHPDFSCEGKVRRLDPGLYPRFADVTDTDGHGTHVAGIVGACTDNDEGVVGTAPDATILPVQALSPEEATAERLAAAIDAAVESGAHVINMSLGFSAAGAPATGSAIALVGGFAADVDPAVQRAVEAGVVVVAAAGNESAPLCGYPAIAEDVVCVGATDRRDLNAGYSNFPVTFGGAAVMAPGGSLVTGVFCDGASESVLSTYSRDATECETYPGYRGLDGTSMASPHVAGVAALVYDRLGGERRPENAQRVIEALTSTAVDLYAPGYDPLSGDGRVDALAAVQSVVPATDPDPEPTGTATPTPTGTTGPAPSTTTTLVASASGQTTDATAVAVRVDDESGRPLAGVPVELSLEGAGGTATRSLVTGEDGTAAVELPLDVDPGEYVLRAQASATDGRPGSQDDQPFSVLLEDSALSVDRTGSGSATRVTAVLTDSDGSAGALAGEVVRLLADGRDAGTATTDGDGTAVFAPQGRDRNARSFEVRFAGDERYRPSSAVVERA